jgi:Protein of unknown function (DUF1194)
MSFMAIYETEGREFSLTILLTDRVRGAAPHRRLISFVEWSGIGAQKIVIDWTIIHDEASA